MATRPDVSGRNLDLHSAVDEVTARYVGANPASQAQYERAKQSLPGGNTRTGMFYTPFPLAIATAAGATLT
ncbi:MAG: aspartate aminotransferase family protein, partial [Rhodospirillaceae bacterium]|nr:aspartate aminotransferase family protein [Rhodospirillaceae bacterium]